MISYLRKSPLAWPILAIIAFMGLMIGANWSVKTEIHINGKTYYARGEVHHQGLCVSFIDYETNHFKTICHESLPYSPSPVTN